MTTIGTGFTTQLQCCVLQLGVVIYCAICDKSITFITGMGDAVNYILEATMQVSRFIIFCTFAAV